MSERTDTSDINGIVVLKYDEGGELSFHVFGEDVRLFIVDERAPHDRVYEMTGRDNPNLFRELIPTGSTIGHAGDERHAAISRRVEGQKFGVVNGGKGSDQ